MGTAGSAQPEAVRPVFVIGAAAASFLWSRVSATRPAAAARLHAPVGLACPRCVVGVVMLALAASLVVGAFAEGTPDRSDPTASTSTRLKRAVRDLAARRPVRVLGWRQVDASAGAGAARVRRRAEPGRRIVEEEQRGDGGALPHGRSQPSRCVRSRYRRRGSSPHERRGRLGVLRPRAGRCGGGARHATDARRATSSSASTATTTWCSSCRPGRRSTGRTPSGDTTSPPRSPNTIGF